MKKTNIIKVSISNLSYGVSIVFKHQDPNDPGHLLGYNGGENFLKDFKKKELLKYAQKFANSTNAIVLVDDHSDDRAIWKRQKK